MICWYACQVFSFKCHLQNVDMQILHILWHMQFTLYFWRTKKNAFSPFFPRIFAAHSEALQDFSVARLLFQQIFGRIFWVILSHSLLFLSYPTIFPISFLDQFSDHSPAFWVILGLNGPLAPHTHSPQCVSANFKKNCASCAVLHQWFSKLEGPMHSKSNEELNWELLAHSSESPPHQCCDPGRGPTSGGTWGMAGDLGAAKCVFYVDFCLK